MTRRIIIIAIACFALGALKGCHCTGGEPNQCIQLAELQTDEVSPAGVRTVFQASDCEGEPIPDLSNDQIKILLDDQDILTEGDVAPVMSNSVDFEMYTLLLLDMSNSIVENDRLGPMIGAARTLVHELNSQGHRVAIYQFAGPAYFATVQDFTTNENQLDAALDLLAESDGLGTTDLYGSIEKALDVLDGVVSPDVLSTSTLVLFTDGTDEAMAESQSSAQSAVDTSESNVFTVGLGGDINKDELKAFGKDGFAWAESTDKLTDAFAEVTQEIQNLANSYYVIGVCSPRVGDWREMTIEVKRGDDAGQLTVYYNAEGFDIVGCNPEQVAFPCMGLQCGTADGFFCGECGAGDYCDESQQCVTACEGDVECGIDHGIDCGDCSDLGDEFVCQENSCLDACAEAQCGFVLGVDCGDCSASGETWFCDDHTCVDACADAECGTFFDIECGDCTGYGDDWGCDETGTCVEACAEVQCGEWFGIDCGDCSSFGDTFGCDSSGTCVDACADAECGDVGDVNCGDCSSYGYPYACDDTNTCVDACAGAECGEILGVDCGVCEDGYSCNEDHLCQPFAIDGMTWVNISGGAFTLGCNYGMDTACDYDEQRHDVLLSDFWIMDTEVTVAMYEQCVTEGECDTANLDTGASCNYGVSGRDDHPINCISWAGLEEFCVFAGGHLPTEAQWERAFRGDHDDVIETYWIYPWGDSPEPSCDRVVMSDGGPGCGDGTTNAVGLKPATSFSLLNMGGNVSEWVTDWYSEELGACGVGDCTDPDGPTTGVERVVRGGNWTDMFGSAVRTARRDKRSPTDPSPSVGGRCMRW